MTMNIELLWYIRSVEILSLIIASVLVAMAFGGYRKSMSGALLLTAMGFGILGVASLLEGVFFEFVGFDLDGAHAIRSTLTVVGFFVLLFSVYRMGNGKQRAVSTPSLLRHRHSRFRETGTQSEELDS